MNHPAKRISYSMAESSDCFFPISFSSVRFSIVPELNRSLVFQSLPLPNENLWPSCKPTIFQIWLNLWRLFPYINISSQFSQAENRLYKAHIYHKYVIFLRKAAGRRKPFKLNLNKLVSAPKYWHTGPRECNFLLIYLDCYNKHKQNQIKLWLID